jgi:hypothetical protein
MQPKHRIQEDLGHLLSSIWMVQRNKMSELTKFVDHHHYTIGVEQATT